MFLHPLMRILMMSIAAWLLVAVFIWGMVDLLMPLVE